MNPATKLQPTVGGLNSGLKVSVYPETWMFIAFISYWAMSVLTMIVAKIAVAPKLAEGPTAYGMDEGSPCGPFNRDWPEENLHKGEGFDFATQTHLQQNFGYAYVNPLWNLASEEYSPAREITAMVYPLFEFSLIVYIILNFVTTILANRRRELTVWFWQFSKAAFAITLILFTQFRMIFVCIAYENRKAHTAAFVALQIALLLMAVQNSLFLLGTNASYDFLGGIHKTRILIKAYLAGVLAVGFVKLTASIFVVGHGYGATWTLKDAGLGGMTVGKVVDISWMFFNAVIPFIVAFIRVKHEVPIVIELSNRVSNESDAPSENQPLKKFDGEGSMKYEAIASDAI